MCGIAGTFAQDPSETVDRAVLEAAAACLQHRGPDGSRTWNEPGAGLAHTRLAIIDVAHGQQPMFSADERYVVVFNGEIYNHHELRSELTARGYRLQTRCDTEVLLYLYDWLGAEMVHRLRGMFAFALYDRERREALLARDRFGKKPLYYTETRDSLRFSSTLDALSAQLPERPAVDLGAIAQYLVLQYVPSPLTPYRAVRKLAPGHLAVWSEGSLDVRPYWEPPLRGQGTSIGSDRREAAQRVRELVGQAVGIRLESDVPLGVFLSGGLDSSTVVAEMGAAGPTPATYSVGFRHAAFDETRYARIVAERFATKHEELVADDDVPDLFRRLIRFYDEPFADSSALATLAVARAASDHVTVILTGDGGDEMFCGYTRYALLKKALALRASLGPVVTAGGLAIEGAGRGLGWPRMARAGRFLRTRWQGYRDTMFHFDPGELAGLLRPDVMEEIRPEAPIDRLDALWERSSGGAAVAPSWIDQLTYLPDDLLTKMDRATMAHGLEARSPLLDHVLAEFCAGLQEGFLFRGLTGKAILREAYADVLPPEILSRGKMGFGVPLAAWMRHELRPFVEELLLPSNGPLAAWFRTDEVSTLVRRFLGGDDGGRWKVWNLLALAGWAEGRIRG